MLERKNIKEIKEEYRRIQRYGFILESTTLGIAIITLLGCMMYVV